MDTQNIHCSACGSNRLAPPTSFTTNPGQVTFRKKGGKGLFGDGGQDGFEVKLAVVCLNCGNVMMFLGPKSLAKVNEILSANAFESFFIVDPESL